MRYGMRKPSWKKNWLCQRLCPHIFFARTCLGGGSHCYTQTLSRNLEKYVATNGRLPWTVLACSWADLNQLAPIVNHMIVGTKIITPSIKSKHTGMFKSSLFSFNLLKENEFIRNVTVKVPHIPEYHYGQGHAKSIEQICAIHIDRN